MGNAQRKSHYPKQISSSGSGTKKVHWEGPGLPAAPGKPILIPGTEETQPDVVSIRWERSPSNGGSAITGYLVEHRKLGSPNWIRSTPVLCKFPEVTLSGLEPGWRYQFRIRAQNVLGLSEPSEISDPLTVTLQRAAASPPQFDLELIDTTSLENDQAEFEVKYSGSPTPKISWFKDGFEIFSSRRTRIVTENGKSVLLIHRTALDDEGEIKCTATNRAGHVSTKARLMLEAPPRIRLPRQYEDGLLFEQDETVRLKVSLAGRPPPEVAWYHDGDMIFKDERHIFESMDGESVLRIPDAKRRDRGEYSVKAMNKLGEDIASFLVTVTDRPSAPGKATVAMTLGRSVTLTWKEPEDDGGCKIGTYIVEYYRVGWDMWLKAATCRQTSTTLGELIEGSEYRFRIKAENPYGVSDPSEESDVVFIPDLKRGITGPLISGKSQSHRDIHRGRSERREVSFVEPSQRTRSLTREENYSREGPVERSVSSQRLSAGKPSRSDSRVTFAMDVVDPEDDLNTQDQILHERIESESVKQPSVIVTPTFDDSGGRSPIPQPRSRSVSFSKEKNLALSKENNLSLSKEKNSDSYKEQNPPAREKNPPPREKNPPPKEKKTPPPKPPRLHDPRNQASAAPIRSHPGSPKLQDNRNPASDRSNPGSPRLQDNRNQAPDRSNPGSPRLQDNRNQTPDRSNPGSPRLQDNRIQTPDRSNPGSPRLQDTRNQELAAPDRSHLSPPRTHEFKNQAAALDRSHLSPTRTTVSTLRKQQNYTDLSAPDDSSILDLKRSNFSRSEPASFADDDENALHGSSEFVLVLYPDDKEIEMKDSSGNKGAEQSGPGNSQSGTSEEEDLVPPPMSLSLPELFRIDHEIVETMREAVSSTELLHERAMERFYRAVAVEEAVDDAKRQDKKERASSESRADTDSAANTFEKYPLFEHRTSLRRKLPTSVAHSALWQAKRDRRRLSDSQTDSLRVPTTLLPSALEDVASDPNLASIESKTDPWTTGINLPDQQYEAGNFGKYSPGEFNLDYPSEGINLDYPAEGINLDYPAGGINLDYSATGKNVEDLASGSRMDPSGSNVEHSDQIFSDQMSNLQQSEPLRRWHEMGLSLSSENTFSPIEDYDQKTDETIIKTEEQVWPRKPYEEITDTQSVETSIESSEEESSDEDLRQFRARIMAIPIVNEEDTYHPRGKPILHVSPEPPPPVPPHASPTVDFSPPIPDRVHYSVPSPPISPTNIVPKSILKKRVDKEIIPLNQFGRPVPPEKPVEFVITQEDLVRRSQEESLRRSQEESLRRSQEESLRRSQEESLRRSQEDSLRSEDHQKQMTLPELDIDNENILSAAEAARNRRRQLKQLPKSSVTSSDGDEEREEERMSVVSHYSEIVKEYSSNHNPFPHRRVATPTYSRIDNRLKLNLEDLNKRLQAAESRTLSPPRARFDYSSDERSSDNSAQREVNIVHQGWRREPEEEMFEPEDRGFEPQDRRFEHQDRRFEPQHQRFEPQHQRFEPQDRRFGPQDRRDQFYPQDQDQQTFEVRSRKSVPRHNENKTETKRRGRSRADDTPRSRNVSSERGASSRSTSKSRNTSLERKARSSSKTRKADDQGKKSDRSGSKSSRPTSRSNSRDRSRAQTPTEAKMERLQRSMVQRKQRSRRSSVHDRQVYYDEDADAYSKHLLAIEAERSVRSTFSYVTDVILLMAAVYVYLFKRAILAIPIIGLILYRRIQQGIRDLIPKWLRGPKR